MATFITLEQAKFQLRIVADDTSQDADILRLMDAAEAVIVTFLGREAMGRENLATWTDSNTVPKDVQHAILYQLTELDRYRGDEAVPRTAGEDLSDVVIGLLRRWAGPVFA